MLSVSPHIATFTRAAAVVLLSAVVLLPSFRAQTATQPPFSGAAGDGSASSGIPPGAAFDPEKDFRVEKFPVAGGAEIITIFADLKGLSGTLPETVREVPLVSILRDTLGDELIENDRLRYVWMLSYTHPSLSQKIAAAIPFLYTRTSNKGTVRGSRPPPHVIDLNPPKQDLWEKALWLGFKSFVLEELAVPVKASTLQYRTNTDNYRRSAMERALGVLSLYHPVEGFLSETELREIQGRMMVSDKFLGSLTKSENLARVYQTNIEQIREYRGRNWELLRQYTETQKLYFEPLAMPDGGATHAIVWVAEPDLKANQGKTFDGRFLNIKNPWKDRRLTDWKGYREVRWFDGENRQVPQGSPGAQPKSMIPLAVFGLDNPRIPALLIDFRDGGNPKTREMSKRAMDDLTGNVLAVSSINNLSHILRQYVFKYVTGRRGMDINRPTRLRSYSHLKLLLSMNTSLDPHLRRAIADRLERVSLNPLENDLEVEVRLARLQYDNLIAFAKRPDGLPARLEKERREEMARVKHSAGQRMLHDLGRVLSFGLYTHREKDTPELRRRADHRRQLEYHERYLREVARTSAKPELDSDIEAVKRSLAFIVQQDDAVSGKTVRALGKLFSITEDDRIRLLCVNGLRRSNGSAARKVMIALYKTPNLEPRWTNLFADLLNLAKTAEPEILSTTREGDKSGVQ